MYYVDLDSAEESLARIANRVRKGGHDIPAEDVRRRFAGRVHALASVLPYCDEATFLMRYAAASRTPSSTRHSSCRNYRR